MKTIKEMAVFTSSLKFSHFRERVDYINQLRKREVWGGSGRSRIDPIYHVRSGLKKGNIEVYLVESSGGGKHFFQIIVVENEEIGSDTKRDWDFPFRMDRRVQIVDICSKNKVLMEGTLVGTD